MASRTPGAPNQPGSGTLHLILIQVASRALTFIGNQFLLRFLSPTLLGVSVQLELVSVTSLYFARDSLRVALQRQGPSPTPKPSINGDANGGKLGAHTYQEKSKSSPRFRSEAALQSQQVVNLSYLSIAIGLAISLVFGYSYISSAPHEARTSPHFTLSFQIYALATLTELLAEPGFLFIQQRALYKARARAETSAAMARCLVACAVAALGHHQGWEASILPFAVGQAAYAMVLLALYLLPTVQASHRDGFSIGPARLGISGSGSMASDRSIEKAGNSSYLDLFPKSHLILAGTMYMQSIFKLLLTQGDAVILSVLSSLADQGAFALASNYGGLLARLVFQPVEESSRNTFGRLISSRPSSSDRGSQADMKREYNPEPKSHHEKPDPAVKYLAQVLHTYLIFSLPLVTLAPHILPLLVRHILSASWYTPSTALLLSTYCYYIPFMAVNGILDAFVTSVATPAQLRGQSVWMVICTGVYGAVSWGLLTRSDVGASALIWANMVNMAMRVGWSVWFIGDWVHGRGGRTAQTGTREFRRTIGEAVPSLASIATAGAMVVGFRISGLSTEDLNRETVGILAAGTTILGSTM
ncbi:hypothetical protein LTR84_005876 [Exophiala bonariae]|uniref:Man(5)GlcNAc(2)-PP-dolichol translocation protein RFT1 n=1 Tax=Exophiala bonariae TaxID=1690606 RepID=A0AAV9N690_9EURO|nr:hypothetical protein LTR84_005876 [Exophiala bonariae]